MKGRSILIGAVVFLLLSGIAGVGLWNWLLGPTLEASTPIAAIPLALGSQGTPTSAIVAPDTSDGAVMATETAGADSLVATPASQAAASPATTGLTVLQISQADSEVRFLIDEELRGQPTTVVGTSNQVAGEIAVDPSDLSTVKVGIIQVNARTLVTDEDRRNRAIRNQILNTDEYEFITFTPAEIIGLSGSVALGDMFSFQIAGDLTIRDATQTVVFDVTAVADSRTQLSGTATAIINRSDFGLVIPSVPFVANVGKEVRLEIDFVAITI